MATEGSAGTPRGVLVGMAERPIPVSTGQADTSRATRRAGHASLVCGESLLRLKSLP